MRKLTGKGWERTRWVHCLTCGGKAAEVILDGHKSLLYVACPNEPCVTDNVMHIALNGVWCAFYLAMRSPETWKKKK